MPSEIPKPPEPEPEPVQPIPAIYIQTAPPQEPPAPTPPPKGRRGDPGFMPAPFWLAGPVFRRLMLLFFCMVGSVVGVMYMMKQGWI